MIDIELVIKIPGEIRKLIFDGVYCGIADKRVFDAIKNGISLPKGHGRLIDVNDLLDDINLEDNDYNRDVNMGEIITLENIDRLSTIIEADKAESEG